MDAATRPRTTPLDPPRVKTYPGVSVVMAVRNEQEDLVESVRAVLDQRYPGEFELVLAVGSSDDDTARLADELAAREERLRVVENPAGFTPHGLNAAIGLARFEYVVRIDGHAMIEADYVRRVIEILVETGAANVGGRMVPVGRGPVSGAIAHAMSSRFGIGSAAFHTGGEASVQPTVYLGAFRRSALRDVGGYDEYFVRAQDWELNHRLRQAGYTVWFDPSLAVTYRPRSSWRSFARQQYRTGGWRRRVIARYPQTASVRYLAPPAVVTAIVLATLVAIVGAPAISGWLWLALGVPFGYLAGVFTVGLLDARHCPWSTRVRVPVAMAVMHLSWGAGFLRRSR